MVVLIYFPAYLLFQCIGPARPVACWSNRHLSIFVTVKWRLMYVPIKVVSYLLWLNHSITNYLHWSFIQFINGALYWGILEWASGQTLATFMICYYSQISSCTTDEAIVCSFETLAFFVPHVCATCDGGLEKLFFYYFNVAEKLAVPLGICDLWHSSFQKLSYLMHPPRPLTQPLARPARPSTLGRMLSWTQPVPACWL